MNKNGFFAEQRERVPAPSLPERVVAALEGLQYGAVEITVHEGKVVQIERREKFRLPTHQAAKN